MFSKGEIQKRLLKFRISGALSERGYCRGGSKIQTLVRKSRGVEGVRRKYPFNKVSREEHRKYMSLVWMSSG